jgi:hypothetical protein
MEWEQKAVFEGISSSKEVFDKEISKAEAGIDEFARKLKGSQEAEDGGKV